MKNEVLNAVMRVGVEVDKYELLKALQYDRDQYSKGYDQGREDAINEMLEKCEANSYTAHSHEFAKWLREQIKEQKNE